MAPDSVNAFWATVAVAVLVAVLTALVWDRVHGWLGWLVRPLAVTLCLVTALSAAGVALNRELGLYSSWAEVFGASPNNAPIVPQAVEAAPITQAGGRIVPFTVTGKASGLTMESFAYLPPGYGTAKLHGQRLPVIEALDGFPGSPQIWLTHLDVARVLDGEITAGRMAPTVVVFPYQTPSKTHDTECVNAVGGLAVDTFLTTDVPNVVAQMFRVRTDGAGWGLVGYSTGGFCAMNLALRHATRYAAAASMSGYFHAITDATTGDLYHGNADARNQNSPVWRVQSLPVPRLNLYLVAARDDKSAYRDMEEFAASARAPLRVTIATLSRGGHNWAAWRAMEAPAFDWLSSSLAGPQRTP
jgi:enterochelin esterase-like enzyme